MCWLVVFILWLLQIVGSALTGPSNVCRHVQDYETIQDNPGCWYNPDVDLDVPDIIKRHGYPLETYNVVTPDQYVLRLFRIPFGTNKQNVSDRQPVFLQHGVLASTAAWVIAGNNSLGFILADNGYDVWLGNSRGSKYAKEHVLLNVQDSQFWNFSYHEMGIYDIPSSLDLITKVTSRKDIIFIGQSMGTTLAYVYSSMLPKHAFHRLKLIVSLAPTVYLSHIRTPFKIIAKYLNVLEELGHGELFPNDPVLTRELCLQSMYLFKFCEFFAFLTFGFDPDQFLPEMFPVILAHYPAGTSLKTIEHLAQGVYSDRFSQYDYGYDNMNHYNSKRPPEYNLSRSSIPNYIMYSDNDFLSTKEDVFQLYKKLRNRAGIYQLKNQMFTHFDFFFSKDVVSVIYDELLKVLDRFRR